MCNFYKTLHILFIVEGSFMKLYIFDKKGIAIILSCVMIALIAVGILTNTGLEAVTTATEQKELPIYSVETKKKQVAISFDAAWGNEQTSKLLAILKEYNVKATFFLVGDWVDKYPDDVKNIAKAGHDIGNHSDTHPHMTEMSQSEQCSEIKACNNKIKKLTGKCPKLFRAPYGDYNNSVVESVKSQGMYCVQWDIDSLDWKDPSPSEMVDRIVPNLQNGSIILMHNGATNTPEALPMIIEAIQNSGYEIVPISKLVCKNCKLNYKTDVTGRVVG
jgi:polysaccharide deacetylase family sporulation protein PdaB